MMQVPVDERLRKTPIWTPDLYLLNTAEKPMSEIENGLATAYPDGTVVWLRPGMLTATCVFDLEDFPRDKQSCFVEFSSWVYDVGMLALKPYAGTWEASLDLAVLDPSVEWHVSGNFVRLNRVLFGCCPNSYETVRFSYSAVRKFEFYNAMFLKPAVGLMALGFFAVLIPFMIGERISFSATILLSLVVFQLILSEHLPRSSKATSLTRQIDMMMTFACVYIIFVIVLTALQAGTFAEYRTFFADLRRKLLRGGAGKANEERASLASHFAQGTAPVRYASVKISQLEQETDRLRLLLRDESQVRAGESRAFGTTSHYSVSGAKKDSCSFAAPNKTSSLSVQNPAAITLHVNDTALHETDASRATTGKQDVPPAGILADEAGSPASGCFKSNSRSGPMPMRK
ncbi:unnamed protein product [Amoebophrya sp. A120]|nr:unnamed protein product [Amoebophrya sp. A120]|eukprot:GSA120T00006217001.1